MRKFIRGTEPEILTNNWEQIGLNYAQKRNENVGYRFQWPQINGQRINHSILPFLLSQTQNHCSYCDGFPLKKGDESIDHFMPKSRPEFYNLVAKWENLFLACKHCQDSKDTQYSENLLRPDADTYAFSSFFIYNFTTNEIEVNESSNISPGSREKAAKTIEIFDLNHSALKKSRQFAITCSNSGKYQVNDLPFRYLFD